MKKFSQCLVVLFCLCFASQLLAITDEEIFRAFSLNLSTPGARARAMGGAFIGKADDATAAETNPAGLSILVKPEVSFEVRYANSRTVGTNIVGIPTFNYDGTPTPIPNPDPGPDDLDEPIASEFHASDHMADVTELGFFSVVYPFHNISIAFSRHELINTDAKVAGSVSASPFHFVEPNSFQGSVNITQANYGISAAGKINDMFFIGGTLKIADFGFESNVAAKQKGEVFYGQHFTSSINETDTQIGFNAGVLVKLNPKVSLGAVYRYEPKFDLTATVFNADRTVGGQPAPTTVVKNIDFDVPDTIGFGVSLTPTRNWTFNLDVLRVYYSQLEPVTTGSSLFTHLLPSTEQADQVEFSVDDGTDIHTGAEYLIGSGETTWAVRGGYAHQTRNRFFLKSAANPEIAQYLTPIFGTNPGNDISHYTAGFGVARGSFQVDVAVDFSDKDDFDQGNKQEISDGGFDVILSSVFRF